MASRIRLNSDERLRYCIVLTVHVLEDSFREEVLTSRLCFADGLQHGDCSIDDGDE